MVGNGISRKLIVLNCIRANGHDERKYQRDRNIQSYSENEVGDETRKDTEDEENGNTRAPLRTARSIVVASTMCMSGQPEWV